MGILEDVEERINTEVEKSETQLQQMEDKKSEEEREDIKKRKIKLKEEIDAINIKKKEIVLRKAKHQENVKQARELVRDVGTVGGFIGSGYAKGSTIITKGKYPATQGLTPAEQHPYLSKGGQFQEQEGRGRLSQMAFEFGGNQNITESSGKKYTGLLALPISEKKKRWD